MRQLKHILGRSDLQRFGEKSRPTEEIRQINIHKKNRLTQQHLQRLYAKITYNWKDEILQSEV